MAASSGAHYSFSVPGNPTPPRYEQLKEDHDPVPVGAGVPLPSTVVHMQQVYVQPPSPRDHFVWSLFSTLYLNFCCLGLLALNFSVKLVTGLFHECGEQQLLLSQNKERAEHGRPPPGDYISVPLGKPIPYVPLEGPGSPLCPPTLKARDRKLVGDHSGASSYGSTAKCLNVMVLMLLLLSIILVIILLSSGAIVVSQIQKSLSEILTGP